MQLPGRVHSPPFKVNAASDPFIDARGPLSRLQEGLKIRAPMGGTVARGNTLKIDMVKIIWNGVHLIRECLIRLATEDLVEFVSQKGFRVVQRSASRFL